MADITNISQINLPKKNFKVGRPKGSGKTVFNVFKNKTNKSENINDNKTSTFYDLSIYEKQQVVLNWVTKKRD